MRSRLRKCRNALDHANRALALDRKDPAAIEVWLKARQMMRQAVADNETQEARTIVDQVTEAMNPSNTEPGGPDQQAALQEKLKAAIEHTDRALVRDLRNEGAWIERVRALKILDPQRAYREGTGRGSQADDPPRD